MANSAAYRPRWILRCAALAALALAWPSGGALRAQEDLPDARPAGATKIGQTAPAWNTQGWVNADSMDLQRLRGSVVLLRFIDDSASSVASLNVLYRAYRDKGLAVVGIYTPSPTPTMTKLEHVRELATAQSIEFPIGLDWRWETLNRYWLELADAEPTASTFLIDRNGVVRYIQADGRYDKNSANHTEKREYDKLESEIQTLLKPDDSAGGKKAGTKSKRSAKKPASGENL